MMTFLAFVALVGAGFMAGRLVRRYQLQHRGPDPTLRIVPPRRYVDADGYSGFRPEKSEKRG
jgi:hypothetical protein